MKNTNFIVLGIVVLAVIAGGIFWFQGKKDAVAPSKSEMVSTAQPEVIKTFEPVAGEDNKVWFSVPELGIEIKVKKDVAGELVYQARRLQAGKDIVSAEFTTKRLINIGKKLYGKTAEEGGSYVCHIGSFVRYSIPEKEYMAILEETYGKEHLTPVSIDGYFVEHTSPQSYCSKDSSDIEYETYVITGWWGKPTKDYSETFNTKENLKESVRRIK